MRRAFQIFVILIGWLTIIGVKFAYGNSPIDERNCNPAQENVAQGKPYLLEPDPNYLHSKGDVHAHTRLTDGVYTDPRKSSFWTETTTVGWAASTVEITLDLGTNYGIRGVAFSSALSTGTDVVLPEAIDVLVSENGQDFYLLGDLVELDKRPRPTGVNKAFKLQTLQLQSHGRYLKLVVKKGGRFFIFTDEVEVFRGDDNWRTQYPYQKAPIRYSRVRFENNFSRLYKARLDSDLLVVRERIANAILPATSRKRLHARVLEIEKAISNLPELNADDDFIGIFPLNRPHWDTYALLGRLNRLLGKPPIAVWSQNELDYLDPMEIPSSQANQKIKISAMKGERRVGVINLTNHTERDQPISLRVDRKKFPFLDKELSFRQVSYTDTLSKIPIAAALSDVDKTENTWQLIVPAGMTRQLWLEFLPNRSRAGFYRTKILIDGALSSRRKIDLELRVFNLRFPQKPTLKIGGFDYTDRPSSATSYGVTENNVDKFVRFLRSKNVSNTWASTWVMPHGAFSREGHFLVEPDTTSFDNWIRRWPNADGYYVYIFASFWRGRFDSTHPSDPLFQRKVGAWASFWANHAKKNGIGGKLWLVPVDEPDERSQVSTDLFLSWSAAIKGAAPELLIWIDPNYAVPSDVPAKVWMLADAISPLYKDIRSKTSDFRSYYSQLAQSGKRLETYVIANNTNDPYTEYRLPAWWAFKIGAAAVSYWAFGDNGGGSWNSWNQYSAEYTSYAPVFLTAKTVTSGKHMEAINFGVQDYEYLVMLRDKIEDLNKNKPNSIDWQIARQLLESSVRIVTESEPTNDYLWTKKRNRYLADSMRVEIAKFLEKVLH